MVYGPKGNHFYRNSRKAIPSDDPAAFTACGCKESRSVEQSEIERKRCLSLRPTEEAPPRRPVPFQTRRLPRINRRNTGPTTAEQNPSSLSDANGQAGSAGRNTSGLLPHIITEPHEFESGSILPRTEHVRDRSSYIPRSRLAVIISDQTLTSSRKDFMQENRKYQKPEVRHSKTYNRKYKSSERPGHRQNVTPAGHATRRSDVRPPTEDTAQKKSAAVSGRAF